MSARPINPDAPLEAVRSSLEHWGVAALSVALSGGVDSTVLAHLCVQALGASRVHLVHVDHQMREDSGRDAAFCAQVAKGLGASFEVARVDVPEGASPQARARAVRYHALASCAMRRGHVNVATAHHEDDAFESALLKMQRGASTVGLGNILGARVTYPGQQTLSLLRPLLGVSRAAVVATARRLGITWVEDPTNATDAYARNALRHHVLPHWLGDEARRAGLRRTLENLGDESRALDSWAQRLFVQCCAPGPHARSVWVESRALKDAPMAVHVRVMTTVHDQLGVVKPWGPRAHDALREALATQASCDVPGARVRALGQRALIEVMASREAPLVMPEAIPLVWTPQGQGRCRWFEFEVTWGERARGADGFCVDVPLGRAVTLRGPLDGEKMPGRGATIARHLSKQGVPASARWAWPCVALDSGALEWVAGTTQQTKHGGPVVRLGFEQMHTIWKY